MSETLDRMTLFQIELKDTSTLDSFYIRVHLSQELMADQGGPLWALYGEALTHIDRLATTEGRAMRTVRVMERVSVEPEQWESRRYLIPGPGNAAWATAADAARSTRAPSCWPSLIARSSVE